MKVLRRWIAWAHGPGAEDGQPLATSLCDLASAFGAGAIEVADWVFIAKLVGVAALDLSPGCGDALHDPVVEGSLPPHDLRIKFFASVLRLCGEIARGTDSGSTDFWPLAF